MRKTILLLALILLVPSAVLAQALRTITGVVTDEAGEPVIAATVYIEETNKAVYTDANGHYTIQAQDGQTVIFSFRFPKMVLTIYSPRPTPSRSMERE